MKEIIFSFALLVQVGFAVAAPPKALKNIKVQHENVKMFQQPGTSTEVLETLSTSDKVALVRKYNKNWAIVTVNDKTGYVLLSELVNLKNVISCIR